MVGLGAGEHGQRIIFEEGNGVCGDVKGSGIRFGKLGRSEAEDALKRGAVVVVRVVRHVGAGNVASTAVNDDAGLDDGV